MARRVVKQPQQSISVPAPLPYCSASEAAEGAGDGPLGSGEGLVQYVRLLGSNKCAKSGGLRTPPGTRQGRTRGLGRRTSLSCPYGAFARRSQRLRRYGYEHAAAMMSTRGCRLSPSKRTWKSILRERYTRPSEFSLQRDGHRCVLLDIGDESHVGMGGGKWREKRYRT